MRDIIKIEHLVHKYDEIIAVNDISFNVKQGSLFAFLGPNGAGKSTTINTLCTTLEKTSGQIFINGYEVGRENNQVRNSIGVVFQESFLDRLLTVRENLKVRASFYQLTKTEFENRLEELVDVVGIRDLLNRRYGTLSGGQRRRVDIARALLNKPRILFLDEPTTGLDPQTRLKVWETILKLQQEDNMTIFLTTHYMEEALEADEVVIIDHGRIVAQDTPEQLRLNYSTDRMRITPKNMDEFISKIDCKHKQINDIIIIPVENSLEALQFLKKHEEDIASFEVIRGTMDDVFVNITGRDIR